MAAFSVYVELLLEEATQQEHRAACLPVELHGYGTADSEFNRATHAIQQQNVEYLHEQQEYLILYWYAMLGGLIIRVSDLPQAFYDEFMSYCETEFRKRSAQGVIPDQDDDYVHFWVDPAWAELRYKWLTPDEVSATDACYVPSLRAVITNSRS